MLTEHMEIPPLFLDFTEICPAIFKVRQQHHGEISENLLPPDI